MTPDARNLTTAFLLTATVFAAVGAAIAYRQPSASLSDAGAVRSTPASHAGIADDAVARLEDYVGGSAPEGHQSGARAGDLLPDVETMIARLAARLASAPDDVAGWRMLGWSYANTARPEQAEAAFAKAAELEKEQQRRVQE